MALPLRLLGRIAGGGGRRGRLPPPLAALNHLSSSHDRNPTRQPPSPSYLLPSHPRFLPFAVPARSFSWYSRSPSSLTPAAAAEVPADEDACAGTESISLGDASTVDYGEVLPGASGGAADAAVGVVAGGDGGGLWGSAMGTVVDGIDGFHSLTGLPW
jgi:YidC/Oxa1 family membrane protein insertase